MLKGCKVNEKWYWWDSYDGDGGGSGDRGQSEKKR